MKDNLKGPVIALTTMLTLCAIQGILNPVQTAETLGAFCHNVYQSFEKGFNGGPVQ